MLPGNVNAKKKKEIEGIELKGIAMQINTNETQEASIMMSSVSHESSQAIQIF